MDIGRLLIFIGIVLIVVGVAIVFFPKLFSWFGHLPGDIRIEKENTRLIIPITSMIIASVILTLLFNGITWFISFFSKLK
jgi:hypothetical protein